jgi:hypothetical protein
MMASWRGSNDGAMTGARGSSSRPTADERTLHLDPAAAHHRRPTLREEERAGGEGVLQIW